MNSANVFPSHYPALSMSPRHLLLVITSPSLWPTCKPVSLASLHTLATLVSSPLTHYPSSHSLSFLSLIILPLTHYSSSLRSHRCLSHPPRHHPAITTRLSFWNRTTNANWSPGNEAPNHDTVDTFYACISSKSLFLVSGAHCTDSYSLLFILISEQEPIFLLIVS